MKQPAHFGDAALTETFVSVFRGEQKQTDPTLKAVPRL